MKLALTFAALPGTTMRLPLTTLLCAGLLLLAPAVRAASPKDTVKPGRAHNTHAAAADHRRKPVPPSHVSPSHVAKLDLPVKPVEVKPAAPEPHVIHNRKIHHTADEVAEQEPAARKATSADFMASANSRPLDHTVEKAEALPPVALHPAPSHTAPIAHPPLAEQLSLPKVNLPPLYNQRGQLIMPPPLKGSHEILVRQNVTAEQEGLERISDDAELLRMRHAKTLVAIPAGPGLRIDERLPLDRRFTRPWDARFLAEIARAHYARFHTALQVNSAVRTVEFQARLMRTNGNAAPVDGDAASPHLTGQAVDIAKKGLAPAEIAWLRGYLEVLIQQGKIDVEEEFQQACFHISVYRSYLPQPPPPTKALATEMHTAAMDAAALHGPTRTVHPASIVSAR